MKVTIVADSTCDLTKEQIQENNIIILPLYVTMDEESRKDGLEITADEIFRYVDAGGALPKTAAVTVSDFADCFSRILKDAPDTEILCLTISSHFSSCFQNACIAAEEMNGKAVAVDSLNLSSGFGHVVLEACRLAKEGHSAIQIKHQLETDIIPNVDASFIIDRLDYLRKGGRCSTVAALGANLLRLKPCIEVRDGKMTVAKKYRGNFNKCVTQYVRDRLENCDAIRPQRIFITHANAEDEAVSAARSVIQEKNYFTEIDESRAGCTIASHCGPNTLGVLYIRK
ncbi:MAG: DegV family protein [Oscillospiraceae bacterium]|nr:DegV family protein [Oscillospiraceae bacterium]